MGIINISIIICPQYTILFQALLTYNYVDIDYNKDHFDIKHLYNYNKLSFFQNETRFQKQFTKSFSEYY